jgi:hypothetical protein
MLARTSAKSTFDFRLKYLSNVIASTLIRQGQGGSLGQLVAVETRLEIM